MIPPARCVLDISPVQAYMLLVLVLCGHHLPLVDPSDQSLLQMLLLQMMWLPLLRILLAPSIAFTVSTAAPAAVAAVASAAAVTAAAAKKTL